MHKVYFLILSVLAFPLIASASIETFQVAEFKINLDSSGVVTVYDGNQKVSEITTGDYGSAIHLEKGFALAILTAKTGKPRVLLGREPVLGSSDLFFYVGDHLIFKESGNEVQAVGSEMARAYETVSGISYQHAVANAHALDSIF